jgi:hypothetical protein
VAPRRRGEAEGRRVDTRDAREETGKAKEAVNVISDGTNGSGGRRLYSVAVFDYVNERGLSCHLIHGDLSILDGQQFVRVGGGYLRERSAEWCDTEAEAIRAAIPRVAQAKAILDSQLRAMHDGRLL